MGAKKKKAKKKKAKKKKAKKKKATKKKAKKGLRNAGKNCWTPCHKKNGKCAWCGTGVCCRHGWKKGGCDGKQGAKKHHACVAQKKAEKKKTEKKKAEKTYPQCSVKMHWMRRHWRSNPFYKKKGVDGTTSSIKQYLGCVEKYCAPPKGGCKSAAKTYPQCSAKMHWMRRNWRSNPFYKKKGVDGTTSSIKQYLGCVEKYCAPPKGGC